MCQQLCLRWMLSYIEIKKMQYPKNMLGVVNFDMTFVCSCWMEGSGHDGNVRRNAFFPKGLPIRPGKYWQDDAGYELSLYVWTLYRGARYHLKGRKAAQAKPTTKERLFNLRQLLFTLQCYRENFRSLVVTSYNVIVTFTS